MTWGEEEIAVYREEEGLAGRNYPAQAALGVVTATSKQVGSSTCSPLLKAALAKLQEEGT